jgi:hypothetical protein
MPDEKTTEPSTDDFSKSLDRLKKQSQDVKARIEQEKRKHDLPLDSNLGDPTWEQNAADGHLDVPEDADD